MFNEAVKKACANAAAKADMAKSKAGRYFVLSVMAGVYISLASFLTNTAGALLGPSPFARIVMGLSFSVGLTMVVFAGSELFTGNILFIGMGILKRTVKPAEASKVLTLCYLGNLAGSLVFAYLIYCSGLLNGPVSEFILASSVSRINLGAAELIARGILCNMTVCLALWMGVRAANEVSKIIFIMMCIFVFVVSGYVHGVADMSHLFLAVLADGGKSVSFLSYVYEISLASFGNAAGGMIIAAAYVFTGSERQ